jgi:hypothetical protein
MGQHNAFSNSLRILREFAKVNEEHGVHERDGKCFNSLSLA